jgi:4-hydroxysphinganine ceramide fatty acyl 2-hydroxylase
MSKRVRIYTAEDVASHSTLANCWISRRGKVYNVSKFVNDHPGGDDILLQYAGKDVAAAMAGTDGEVHEHSDAAYDMLAEYQIGKLGTEESMLRDGSSKQLVRPSIADFASKTSTPRTTSIQR